MTPVLILLLSVSALSYVTCDIGILRPGPPVPYGYGGPGFIGGDWDDNGYIVAGDYGPRGLSVLPPYDNGFDGGYIGGQGGFVRKRYGRRMVHHQVGY